MVKPYKMSSPTRDDQTNPEQVVINWIALDAPENGDSQVLGYNVQWDKGTSGVTWSDVSLPVQSYTGTQLSVVDGVEQGESYMFKVRAKNIYGFGEFSDPATVIASSVPGEPEIATTTTQGKNVIVGFFAPDANGATIMSYAIKIAGLNGIYYQNPECDSTLTPGTNDYFSCSVSFVSLRADPFNLVYGSLVSVIVSAANNIASGKFSQPSVFGSTV